MHVQDAFLSSQCVQDVLHGMSAWMYRMSSGHHSVCRMSYKECLHACTGCLIQDVCMDVHDLRCCEGRITYNVV